VADKVAKWWVAQLLPERRTRILDRLMSQPPAFDPEKYLDATAPALGLTVKPEWRGAVVFNLTLAARIANALAAKPVSDHVEQAPIFKADQ
jgi:hypothetical protein